MTLIEELKWRGLISQTVGNIQEILSKPTTFYIGIDPTADSLGVHHIIGLLTSKIFQKYGHTPIVLVGGATCSIGDPSGKTEERKAITMEQVFHNVECVQKQVSRIIDFSSDKENNAILLNNYEWMKDYTFLDFMRNVGKKITVNYMMAKENVKNRLGREGSGISCQEFIYGLIQGNDFVYLNENYNCKVQIGGTDNLSNICTGIELLRKMNGVTDVCGITWDLITTADGKKFGKSEGNTVWLDAEKTSPYQFMQFWLNQSDEDAIKFSKMFLADRSVEEITESINEHMKTPEKRILQKMMAKDMTILIHGEEAYNMAVKASSILFGKSTTDDLKSLDGKTFDSIMRDVPSVVVDKEVINNGITVIDLASNIASLGSKTELRTLMKGNGFSANKTKINNPSTVINSSNMINDKYILLQKGKKDYMLVIAN